MGNSVIFHADWVDNPVDINNNPSLGVPNFLIANVAHEQNISQLFAYVNPFCENK